MKTRGTLRLATRGSALARRQAALVAEALEDRRYEVELVTVETTGDQLRDELIHRLGKTGAFVRELDERVLSGDVDGAIHSMKDMPTEQPHDLVTAAVPERGPPGDVLVTPDGATLEELPGGAVVGTSSLRRRAQLLSERPDLAVEPLRGNVDTRLEKLLAPALQAEHQERSESEARRASEKSSGRSPQDADRERKGEAGNDDFEPAYDRTVDEWFDDLSEIERRALGREVDTEYDAIVLAEAGIQRSGLAHHVAFERLPTSRFTPAPGQGTLAVTMAEGDAAREINEAIDHPRTRVVSTVERAILAELGGGCIAPIGIHAAVQGEYVHATVQVFDRDGEESVTGSRDLPIESHAQAAREFARHLADRGAADLIASAREDADPEGGESDDSGDDAAEPDDGGDDASKPIDADAADEGAASKLGEDDEGEASKLEEGDGGAPSSDSGEPEEEERR